MRRKLISAVAAAALSLAGAIPAAQAAPGPAPRHAGDPYLDLPGYGVIQLAGKNAQFTLTGGAGDENFLSTSYGTVTSNFPFGDTRYDSLYHGKSVWEWEQQDAPGTYLGIDTAFHSGVKAVTNPGTEFTLWVLVGKWVVNVAATDHNSSTYPYGWAMFASSDYYANEYVAYHQAAGGTNQWTFCWPLTTCP